MNVVTREDLRQLVASAQFPSVSIYQPTHRSGPDTRTYAQQDPIRLKNLLRIADERLTAGGLRPREVQDFLAPARQLLDDSSFWQYQADGLGVFLTRSTLRTFRVPVRFEELVVVAPSFHLKPLLALLTGDGLFYVLALSQNQVRLLAGTRDHMGEVALPGAPTSLADALRFDDPERQLQSHTVTAGSGRDAALFHGHGAGVEDGGANLLRFFQQVDRALVSVIGDASTPLVLAAVEYLMPIYRKANTHPSLMAQGIAGNPERLRPDELHARAWPLVEPHFRRDREAAAERYRAQRGTGKAVSDVGEVVVAAVEGRVDVLFVAVGVRAWGTYAPPTRTVEIVDEPSGRHEDLLNLAAIHTVLNRGTVYALPPAGMPDGTTVAAVLRY